MVEHFILLWNDFSRFSCNINQLFHFFLQLLSIIDLWFYKLLFPVFLHVSSSLLLTFLNIRSQSSFNLHVLKCKTSSSAIQRLLLLNSFVIAFKGSFIHALRDDALFHLLYTSKLLNFLFLLKQVSFKICKHLNFSFKLLLFISFCFLDGFGEASCFVYFALHVVVFLA